MNWAEATMYMVFFICITVMATTCAVKAADTSDIYSYPDTDILHSDTDEYYHPYPDNIDTRWWDKGIIDRDQQLYGFDPLNVEIYNED